VSAASDEPNFDKFLWLNKLSADPRFSAQQRQLGTVIGTTYTWKTGHGWAVELAELAAASGYKSVRTVNPALTKLCKAGYLVETYRRNTGPGKPAQVSYTLRHPNTDINTDTLEPNTDINTATPQCNTDTLTIEKHKLNQAALIAKGKAIFESNKYAPKGPPMDLGPWGP
jgi:hypothetical protein